MFSPCRPVADEAFLAKPGAVSTVVALALGRESLSLAGTSFTVGWLWEEAAADDGCATGTCLACPCPFFLALPLALLPAEDCLSGI